MAGHAAVGVDDDLAPGQAGVAHRATDHETPGRVDQQARAQRVGVVQLGGQDGHDDVLPEVVADDRLDALAMLAGDEDALDRDRLAVGGQRTLTWVLPSGRR